MKLSAKKWLSLVSACLLFAFIFAPSYVQAAKYKASAVIVATLPPYCYAQYVDGLESDPRFQIRDCGAYTNHFCPGLVEIEQSKKVREYWEKKELLLSAIKNMNYSIEHTKGYPKCFLGAEAEAKKILIQQMLKSLHR